MVSTSTIRALALAGVTAAFVPTLAQADGFSSACPAPFSDIPKQTTAIDSVCSIDGKSGESATSLAQNRVKNNFCATGIATPLSFKQFLELQQTVDNLGVSYGGRTVFSGSRSVLTNLNLHDGTRVGEGSVVQIAAYVQGAHYSDTKTGETVNCNIPGDEYNDIHIPLVSDLSDDTCDSVTAEVIPHWRPDAITPDVLNRINRPVRFRGQLFFDASHHPCSDSGRANPPREASWEIHPVYEIDVCKETDLDDCPVGDDTKWSTLKDWEGTDDSDTE